MPRHINKLNGGLKSESGECHLRVRISSSQVIIITGGQGPSGSPSLVPSGVPRGSPCRC